MKISAKIGQIFFNKNTSFWGKYTKAILKKFTPKKSYISPKIRVLVQENRNQEYYNQIAKYLNNSSYLTFDNIRTGQSLRIIRRDNQTETSVFDKMGRELLRMEESPLNIVKWVRTKFIDFDGRFGRNLKGYILNNTISQKYTWSKKANGDLGFVPE